MGSHPPIRDGRPDPDELLKLAESEDPQSKNGQLKIFLGYYSGVGKSFRMLDEGRRRHERGEDVVIGALQSEVTSGDRTPAFKRHRADSARSNNGDTKFMDLEAIKRRHPGSLSGGRFGVRQPAWQQTRSPLGGRQRIAAPRHFRHHFDQPGSYIEEESARVEKITGKHVTQTVPRAVHPARPTRLWSWTLRRTMLSAQISKPSFALLARDISSRSCVRWRWCWRPM